MRLRMIPYGYRIEQGKIAVSEEEARFVKMIFHKYAANKGLQEISDELTARGAVFYDGKVQWYKSRVNRILANEKYIGKDDYPPILTGDEFERAARLRDEKSFQKGKCPQIIECLKRKMYCGQCGRRLYRIPRWSTREKWLCQKDCRCEAYISETELFDGILKAVYRVKKDFSILREKEQEIFYERTPEIMRRTNELGRMMDLPDVGFQAGKRIIFDCAAMKFQACREDKHTAYTEKIVKECEAATDGDILRESFIEKVIDRIEVCQDGRIAVQFVNGIVLTSEARKGHGSRGKKNSNKDRSESVTGKE